MKIDELNDLVKAVCPIDGLNSDGVIWFKSVATQPQKDAARAIVSANLHLLVNSTSSTAV